MSLIRVKPAEGRRVRLEDGMIVPEDGIETELTMFVRRRLDDGDLVEVPASAKPGPRPAAIPETIKGGS